MLTRSGSNLRRLIFNQFLGLINFSMKSVIISKLTTSQLLDHLDDDVDMDTFKLVLDDHKINVMESIDHIREVVGKP